MEKIWAATMPIGSAWPELMDASVMREDIKAFAKMFKP